MLISEPPYPLKKYTVVFNQSKALWLVKQSARPINKAFAN